MDYKQRSRYYLKHKRHKGKFLFIKKKNRAVREVLKELA
jgi:hypothetical protein